MIQKYVTKKNNEEITKYKIRVFFRSKINPTLRFTKYEAGILTEAQAIKREAQLKKEGEREMFDLDSKGVLCSGLVSSWYTHFEKLKVATGQRTKATHDDYFGTIRKWFKDYWNRPAAEINPYVMNQIFIQMKEKGLCFAQRKKIKQILKSVFDYGIQSGLLNIPRSPTFEVVLKKDTEKKPEILSIQEIQKLIGKAFENNHEWRRIWFTALTTGMRSGELQALEWSDVSWENNLINVNKSYNCKVRSYGPTKAGYWRQVPISTDLLEILKEQQQEMGNTKYVFPRSWEWDRDLQAKVLRRFCYAHGIPSVKFRKSSCSKIMEQCCLTSGLHSSLTFKQLAHKFK